MTNNLQMSPSVYLKMTTQALKSQISYYCRQYIRLPKSLLVTLTHNIIHATNYQTTSHTQPTTTTHITHKAQPQTNYQDDHHKPNQALKGPRRRHRHAGHPGEQPGRGLAVLPSGDDAVHLGAPGAEDALPGRPGRGDRRAVPAARAGLRDGRRGAPAARDGAPGCEGEEQRAVWGLFGAADRGCQGEDREGGLGEL